MEIRRGGVGGGGGGGGVGGGGGGGGGGADAVQQHLTDQVTPTSRHIPPKSGFNFF